MVTADGALAVEVIYGASPGTVWQWRGELPAGSNVHDALRLSGWLAQHPQLDAAQAALGIWGRRCALEQPLRDRDRVEVYRPLRVDPKEARRQRYQAQVKGQRMKPRR